MFGRGPRSNRRRVNPGVWDRWLGQLHELPVAAIDVETSGLDPARDRVLEVAVVADGHLVLESLVRPGDGHVGDGPHRLTAQSLERAPSFAALLPQIRHTLAGRLVVGHNVAFDLAFLATETARAGSALPSLPHACTVRLAEMLDLGHPTRKLGWACERYGITLERPHHAADDALAAMALFGRYTAIAAARGVGLAEIAIANPADATVRSWRHPPLGDDPELRHAA